MPGSIQAWRIDFDGELSPGAPVQAVFSYDAALLRDEASLMVAYCPASGAACQVLNDDPTTLIATGADLVGVELPEPGTLVIGELPGVPALGLPMAWILGGILALLGARARSARVA